MWPLQKDCDAFYGNPRGAAGHSNPAWEAANLVHVSPPFRMYYAGKYVASVKVHRKCADSLTRVFAAIWAAAGHNQATIDKWGVSTFGGSYNFRPMRGSNRLSMHSYGCAIDLAPERFPMGSHAHTFDPLVVKAFADEGWVNLPNDRMHFQAARVSGVPAPAPASTVKPKPAVVQVVSKIPVAIAPKLEKLTMNQNTVNHVSLAGLAGAIGYLLPSILQTWQTAGLVAAGVLILCYIAQMLLPVGTVQVAQDVATKVIPSLEGLDPALKPYLEEALAGIKAAQAVKPQ